MFITYETQFTSFFKSGCKGTAFFLYIQIFLQKNAKKITFLVFYGIVGRTYA